VTSRDGRATDLDKGTADVAALSPLLWDRLAESTLAMAAPSCGERVLDACCGLGASALPAARLVGPTGQLDAVDTSSAMVSGLRERLTALPWAEAFHADVTTWPGRGYDLVQCVMGIFFLRPMQPRARLLAQLSHDRGRAVFTVWREGAMEAPARALTAAVAAARGTRPPAGPGAHPLAALDTQRRFGNWLAELGTGSVRVREQHLSITLDEHVAWLLVTGSSFVEMLRGLSDAQVAEVRDRYLARLLPEGEVDASHLVGLLSR